MQNEYYMRQKLLNSNVMYNVLECLELKEKLEIRYINKRIGKELVPNSIN